jgi:hypothetical protein
VDSRAEIRELLITRRAKVTPEQAGLQRGGVSGACPGCGGKRSPSWPASTRNLSSSSTHSGQPFMAHYVSAKSAVNGLATSLTLE